MMTFLLRLPIFLFFFFFLNIPHHLACDISRGPACTSCISIGKVHMGQYRRWQAGRGLFDYHRKCLNIAVWLMTWCYCIILELYHWSCVPDELKPLFETLLYLKCGGWTSRSLMCAVELLFKVVGTTTGLKCLCSCGCGVKFNSSTFKYNEL